MYVSWLWRSSVIGNNIKLMFIACWGKFCFDSNESTNAKTSFPLSFCFLGYRSSRKKGRLIQSKRNYIEKDFSCLELMNQETLRMVGEAVGNGKKGTLGRRFFPSMQDLQVFTFLVVAITLKSHQRKYFSSKSVLVHASLRPGEVVDDRGF